MAEVVAAIEAAAPGARISFEDISFGDAAGFDGSALEAALGPIEWRPLERGVQETVDRFRELESWLGSRSSRVAPVGLERRSCSGFARTR